MQATAADQMPAAARQAANCEARNFMIDTAYLRSDVVVEMKLSHRSPRTFASD